MYGHSEGIDASVDGLGRTRMLPERVLQAIPAAHLSECFVLHSSSHICEISTLGHVMPL